MASDRIRFLVVSPTLTEALLLVRVRTSRPPKAILDADVLAEVERAIDGPLPEELLAYFAATGADLAKVGELTVAAREDGLDAGRIAFARSPTGVFVAGVHDGGLTVGEWDMSDAEPVPELPFTAFVRRHHDLHPPEDHEHAKLDKAREVFAPCVAKKAEERPSHVSHPKFGEGRVVSEIFDGNHKLVVDFADGRRTLMARFVQAIDKTAS